MYKLCTIVKGIPLGDEDYSIIKKAPELRKPKFTSGGISTVNK